MRATDHEAAEALAEVQRLLRIYGSIQRAGRAYDERHGLSTLNRSGAGDRLFHRLLSGEQRSVRDTTFDRLTVVQ